MGISKKAGRILTMRKKNPAYKGQDSTNV